MILNELHKHKLIHPPDWLVSNTHYLTEAGSVAYGVSAGDSDRDIYGFCIPPKHVVFPHLDGEILGFGRQKKRFDQWQEHHIFYADDLGGHGRTYDISVYNIVRYFHLCMENNPNMIDTLFTPVNCVLHQTAVANMVRDSRKLFLHRGSWPKFKGYAYSQLHKMDGNPEGKRKEIREKFGFDVKFAYHVVRLLYEAEMILNEGDIDLQRHKEHLKAIRRGEVPEDDIRQWATDKEAALERAYEASQLPWGPDEPKIKQLLLDCLEHHYGTIAGAIVTQDAATRAVTDIEEVVQRYRRETVA